MADAIKAKALCEYYYFPILVNLTESEGAEYLRLSRQIAQASNKKDDTSAHADYLLLQRARLVATASGKEKALIDLTSSQRPLSHWLFYCGDGVVEGDLGESIRHVDQVARTLSSDLGIRVAKFTAENTSEERSSLLQSFDRGEIQGLVAIRCLDEGVDVPSTQTAVILASSTNPRQFIQRRGRILRKSPGKTDARIYDMIVCPPPSDTFTSSERRLMIKELTRYSEFAKLAKNGPQAQKMLWPLQKRFHLTHI